MNQKKCEVINIKLIKQDFCFSFVIHKMSNQTVEVTGPTKIPQYKPFLT